MADKYKFFTTHESDIDYHSIFWHLKGRVNWTSDINMVKITGTSSIYFDPWKFWPVNDYQIYVLVKLYSTEGWSVEQVLASAPQNPLNLQYNFGKHW